MAPKEPTRAQLSSRLSYSQHTPTFLRRLQNKYTGNQSYNDEDDEEEQGRYRDDPEFEDFDHGSGRPPIPRRPAIPERPPDDPGSADEDDADEKPQVVVLKEGKHLTEREAENIRRKVKGLPPLPDPPPELNEDIPQPKPNEGSSESKSKSKKPPLMFSTANSTTKPSAAKRKLDAVGRISDNEEEDDDDRIKDKHGSRDSRARPAIKKQKKNAKAGPKTKKLLSFGDDA